MNSVEENSAVTKLLKVGLTGGIAAGKTSTLRQWEAAGAQGVEADELAHRALEPKTPTWQQVVATFGGGILNEDGSINRPKLGGIVFADAEKRARLNAIIHPAVWEMWMTRLAQLEQGPAAIVVASVPLLYEVAAESRFDCVVVVGCSEAVQIERLGRKGLSASQARARIAAQWPLQKKMDRSDFVIWNDGSPTVLDQQAAIIWGNLKEIQHAPSTN